MLLRTFPIQNILHTLYFWVPEKQWKSLLYRWGCILTYTCSTRMPHGLYCSHLYPHKAAREQCKHGFISGLKRSTQGAMKSNFILEQSLLHSKKSRPLTVAQAGSFPLLMGQKEEDKVIRKDVYWGITTSCKKGCYNSDFIILVVTEVSLLT